MRIVHVLPISVENKSHYLLISVSDHERHPMDHCLNDFSVIYGDTSDKFHHHQGPICVKVNYFPFELDVV